MFCFCCAFFVWLGLSWFGVDCVRVCLIVLFVVWVWFGQVLVRWCARWCDCFVCCVCVCCLCACLRCLFVCVCLCHVVSLCFDLFCVVWVYLVLRRLFAWFDGLCYCLIVGLFDVVCDCVVWFVC